MFEELPPQTQSDVNCTTFRYKGNIYTVATSDIRHVLSHQLLEDRKTGYLGPLLPYETMLFINGESDILYPFGSLPGHLGLGVFQRYETEEEARDGHQQFITDLKRYLLTTSNSVIP